MKKLVTAAIVAAATTAASWVVRRWLDARYASKRASRSINGWENEGGALAPAHHQIENAQVPRSAQRSISG